MRWAAQRDANEKLIVGALRAMGATVYHLHQPVDLLIGFRGETLLAEVKTTKGKLNSNQVRFVEEWRGSPVVILRSIEDAHELVRSITA